MPTSRKPTYETHCRNRVHGRHCMLSPLADWASMLAASHILAEKMTFDGESLFWVMVSQMTCDRDSRKPFTTGDDAHDAEEDLHEPEAGTIRDALPCAEKLIACTTHDGCRGVLQQFTGKIGLRHVQGVWTDRVPNLARCVDGCLQRVRGPKLHARIEQRRFSRSCDGTLLSMMDELPLRLDQIQTSQHLRCEIRKLSGRILDRYNPRPDYQVQLGVLEPTLPHSMCLVILGRGPLAIVLRR